MKFEKVQYITNIITWFKLLQVIETKKMCFSYYMNLFQQNNCIFNIITDVHCVQL